MPTAPDTASGPGIYHIGAYTIRFPTFGGTHQGELTQEGWNYEIGGTVEGLTGIGLQIYNQVVYLIQQLPISPALLPGAAISGYPFSILRDYRVRPLSNGVAEFGCIFRGMSPGSGNTNILRVSHTAQQIERNLDINGNLLKVLPPPSILADTSISSANENLYVKDPQTKTVSAFTPAGNIEISRLEIGGSPVGDSDLYTSTVNSGAVPWNRNAQPRTWMCMGIEEESHDLGITWQRTYKFQRGPVVQASPLVTGWDATLVWIDPRTGNAPGGATGVPALIAVNPGSSSNNAYQLALTEDFTIFGFLFNF